MNELKWLLMIALCLAGVACSPRKFNAPVKGPEAIVAPFSCSSKTKNAPVQVVSEKTYGVATADVLSLTQRFKNFASASVDPKNLGTLTTELSSANPLMVQLVAPLGEDDKINLEEATIEFTAQDSLSNLFDDNGNWVEPYKIRFDKMKSGDYDSKKPATWFFSDEFGDVSIEWQLSSDSTWIGTIKFENDKVVGLEEKQSGVLGVIKVAPCTLQRVPTT